MNGVYSPGMLQVTLSNHLPTFSPITQDTAYQPSFSLSKISATCLLWFCGNSLTVLSSWPLDEPVYSSSHSKAGKLLRATTEKGNSQCFLRICWLAVLCMDLNWHTSGSASCIFSQFLPARTILSSFQSRTQNCFSAVPPEEGAVPRGIMEVLTACSVLCKRQNKGSPCPGELSNIA